MKPDESNKPAAAEGTLVPLSSRDGDFNAFACEPPNDRTPMGAVVLLHEIFGITDKIRGYARDYASCGLRVIVPDLFWRIEAGVELGHDAQDMKRAMARLKLFDDEAALADTAACVAWLRQGPSDIPISTIGFCLGGKLAVMARMRGLADAYVAYYGVGLDHVQGDLAQNDAPLLLHFGNDDSYVPIESVRQLAPRLGKNVTLHGYDDTGHAFYRPGKTAASSLSKERTLAFLRDISTINKARS
ncbi:MAG: dienelactone hydrolase family protein [Variovorax sp.]